MKRKKNINFTVVPQDDASSEQAETIYSNFCAVSHTPFDFTLTFCQMRPLNEKDFEGAPEGETQTIPAPVKIKVVVPANLVPALGAALQENLRIYQEAYSNVGWAKGKLGGDMH